MVIESGHLKRVNGTPRLITLLDISRTMVEIRCRVWRGPVVGVGVDCSPDAILTDTSGVWPEATPGLHHRKSGPERSYLSFWRPFCKERTWIPSPPIRPGKEAILAYSRPCNHPSILWTARTACSVLWGRSVGTARRGTARAVCFRPL